MNLTKLDETTDEYKRLSELIEQSKGPHHETRFSIESISSINRTNETDYDRGGKVLLFHGTRAKNVEAILKKGLVKCARNAPKTGYMFGKGVYFANVFSETLKYTRAQQGEMGYVFICTVSLGTVWPTLTPKTARKDTLPPGVDSIKAVGRFAPREEIHYQLPNGVIVPFGPIEEQYKEAHVDYDEFVAFDTRQITMSYLVEVKIL